MPYILNDVLISDDGWLFAYQGTNSIHHILQGKTCLSDSEISAWQEELQKRHDFCHALQAEYHFIIAPLKQCIYPEKLAGYPISPNRPALQLQKNSLANYPLSFLQETKTLNTPYYQYDTHWNDFACDAFYSELLKQKLPYPIEKTCTIPLHDLWIKIHKEPCPIAQNYRYKQNNIVYCNNIENVGGLFICSNPKHKPYVGVIFGDSFSRFTLNTISQYFSQLFFFHTTGFDTDILQKLKPDAVINCYAENFIHTVGTIRFQNFFEALLYKFLISGKNCIYQKNEFAAYTMLMPEKQVQILREIMHLYQKPQFRQEHILDFLCTQYHMDRISLEKILGTKKHKQQ